MCQKIEARQTLVISSSMSESPHPVTSPHVETRLVYAHGLAALITLLISVGFGALASIELLVPDLVAGHGAWLSWGRLRYDHTQGIMLGWLGNAFFAFLYHAVPLLTGRSPTETPPPLPPPAEQPWSSTMGTADETATRDPAARARDSEGPNQLAPCRPGRVRRDDDFMASSSGYVPAVLLEP